MNLEDCDSTVKEVRGIVSGMEIIPFIEREADIEDKNIFVEAEWLL